VPGANRDVHDRYVAELQKENRPTDDIRFASGTWCLNVSDDPQKTFAEAADHVIYQANNYSEWLAEAGLQPLAAHLGDREQLRQSGLLKVVDPDTAISMIRNFSKNSPSHTSIRGRCRWTAAAIGANASGVVRLEGDSRVSLISAGASWR
jgi:hypothetical protein